ncbi:hypothetical protein D9C01_12240 [Corynebacterium diphtheriae]|nr:hypothetical protein D9C01_12240 [Corynebacterium diphtheriae]
MAYVILPLINGLRAENFVTLIFALVATGLVFWGAARLPKTKEPSRFTGSGVFLAALLLTFYVPVAAGRMLAEPDSSPLALGDSRLWWQYAVGASFLIVVACLISLIPPYKGRPVGMVLVCLIVAAIFGFVYALPRA